MALGDLFPQSFEGFLKEFFWESKGILSNFFRFSFWGHSKIIQSKNWAVFDQFSSLSHLHMRSTIFERSLVTKWRICKRISKTLIFNHSEPINFIFYQSTNYINIDRKLPPSIPQSIFHKELNKISVGQTLFQFGSTRF